MFVPSDTWKRPPPAASAAVVAAEAEATAAVAAAAAEAGGSRALAVRSAVAWPAPSEADEAHFEALRVANTLDEARMADADYRMRLIAWWLNGEMEDRLAATDDVAFAARECAWLERRLAIRPSALAGGAAGMGVFATADLPLERTDDGARCVAVVGPPPSRGALPRRCPNAALAGTARCAEHPPSDDDAQPFQNYVLGAVDGRKVATTCSGWPRFVGIYRGEVYNWRLPQDVAEMRRRVAAGTFGTHHTFRMGERPSRGRGRARWGPVEVDGATRGNWLSFLNDADTPEALRDRGVAVFEGLDPSRPRRSEEAHPSRAHILLVGTDDGPGAFQIRDIKAGEEIFTTYGPSWWRVHERDELPRVEAGANPFAPNTLRDGVVVGADGEGLVATSDIAEGDVVASVSDRTFVVTGKDDAYEMLLRVASDDATLNVRFKGSVWRLGDPTVLRDGGAPSPSWASMRQTTRRAEANVELVVDAGAGGGGGRQPRRARFVARRAIAAGDALTLLY